MITSFAFVLLMTVLCVAIWFRVRKNVPRTSDTYPHHSQSGGMVMPLKKDQPEEKSQTAQPADTPIDAEAFQWSDRRLSERWRDWLALTTTIIAVMTVGMTLQVSQYLTLSLISQGKETNTWGYYQAKSGRSSNSQIAKAALELQLATNPGISAENAEKYRITIKKYDDEIRRYKDEMEEIQQQGEALGKARDKANKAASGFNYALLFLQVSIVLSSIATMVRKKYIWYTSLAAPLERKGSNLQNQNW